MISLICNIFSNSNYILMYQSIRARRPKLNKFDLTHEHKLSCNMGQLIPIYLQEIVPGDRFRVSSEIMMRLAPMLSPIMHRVDVWTHYFFVPNRIIWEEFQDFITGGEDGLQQPEWPWFSYQNIAGTDATLVDVGSLLDYFGMQVIGAVPTEDLEFSALPVRAYVEIYNEYYRDQNLEAKVSNPKTSGVQLDLDGLQIRQRAWEKDYFTSALPWAQRGAGVTVPLSVEYKPISDVIRSSDGASFVAGSDLGVHNVNAGELAGDTASSSAGNYLTQARIENIADAAGVDINDLRNSNAIQRWLELAARGGSRYIEQIRNFFGVTSSDARLQRPEYLGGGRQNVVISEVLQTAATETAGTTDTPLGEMGGHGVSVGTTNQFKKGPFEEHGFVMGIMSVLPRTAYQQGVHRLWTRRDKFDYYFPQFAHLGEQEIKNREIFFDDASSVNQDVTWGYQSRYAEYKHMPSQVSGDFRTSLNYWHMGRIFSSLPPLNEDFVKSDPTHRIFANTTPGDHKLWVQVLNRISALRPMPYFGTPRL